MPFARCWFSDANRPPSLLVRLCQALGKKPPKLLRPSLSWLGCRVSPPFSECPINPPVLPLQRQDPVQGYVQISAGDLAASGPGRELPLQGGLQGLPPVPSRDHDRDRQRGAASNPPPPFCSTTTAPHEGTFMLLSFEFKEVQTLPEPAAVTQGRRARGRGRGREMDKKELRT